MENHVQISNPVKSTCYYHSSKEGKYVCKECNKKLCKSCIIFVEGEPFCQLCWDGYVEQVRANEQHPPENPNQDIPWINWKRIGLIRAFLDTFRQVTFHPQDFFEKLPVKTGFSTPFLFAFICGMLFWYPMVVTYIKFLIPSMLEQSLQLEQSHSLPASAEANTARLDELNKSLKGLSHLDLLAIPIDTLFRYIVFASLMQHFLIYLFHGKQGFVATFQIRCFAMVAQFLQIIPFFGFILAEGMSIALCARGFQIVQRVSLSQAILVSIVPPIFSLLMLTVAM